MCRGTKHALTLSSCSCASSLRFVLAVLHGRSFAQSNHTAFLFLLIEITFIFLIVLKLVMSCTLPYEIVAPVLGVCCRIADVDDFNPPKSPRLFLVRY
jgi:hypothetical protein